MVKEQEKTATNHAEWVTPVLNKLSLKDAQADLGASNFDGAGYS